MDERTTTIRPLRALDEFLACQAIQREAWGFPDLLIIPYTQLLTLHQYGGVVLGAFDGERLVGFVFGFLGRDGSGPPYLFSQRMGVLPAWQGQGIGEALKWAQRAWALERGLGQIGWTYDPLEPANAYLNVAKLGGVVRRYKRDIYGEHDSPLHRGLPSDRFLLEWELEGERVRARLSPGWSPPRGEDLIARCGPPLNEVTLDARGLPECGPLDLGARRPAVCVQVPADWQGLRRADMALAGRWRAATRELFERYLADGYAVTGYAAAGAGEQRRNLYQLERAALPAIEGGREER